MAEQLQYLYGMEMETNINTFKETIIRCIEAPRLKGISTRHFIEFKRLRDLYEKRLKEKEWKLKEKKKVTSYRASIEDEDLRSFIAAGWVECSSLEELTESQIIRCVKKGGR